MLPDRSISPGNYNRPRRRKTQPSATSFPHAARAVQGLFSMGCSKSRAKFAQLRNPFIKHLKNNDKIGSSQSAGTGIPVSNRLY